MTANLNMNPFTDLKAVFQDGYDFEYDFPYDKRQKVTISVHTIGNLILTSGKVIARDPLREPDPRYYFTQTLKPGNYPVSLSVANFQPRQETRIACAMLRISEQPTVRWEIAAVNEQHPQQDEGETYGYSVDTGTGCFMDYEAEQALDELASPDPAAYEATNRISPNRAWKLCLAALDRYEQEFCYRVMAEMEKNEFGNSPVASWADLRANDKTEANVITFSSGHGDGGYTSYWGYDPAGNLTSLVTDFEIFGSSED